MSKPNFFIVGAPRCGTTAIYNYLNQHPLIKFSRKKETNFFLFHNRKMDSLNDYQKGLYNRSVTDLHEYESLFSEFNSKKIDVIGEASPLYLSTPWVANAIYNFNSDAKILIIIRQPINRAFSHFKKDFSGHSHNTVQKFTEMIESENIEKEELYTFGEHYIRLGLYHDQILKYLNLFNNNVKIITYEDFSRSPNKMLNQICSFLEISNMDFHVLNKVNPSGKPRLQFMDNILTGTKNLKGFIRKYCPDMLVKFMVNMQSYLYRLNLEDEVLSNDFNAELMEKYYKEEIIKLMERKIINNNTEWI